MRLNVAEGPVRPRQDLHAIWEPSIATQASRPASLRPNRHRLNSNVLFGCAPYPLAAAPPVALPLGSKAVHRTLHSAPGGALRLCCGVSLRTQHAPLPFERSSSLAVRPLVP